MPKRNGKRNDKKVQPGDREPRLPWAVGVVSFRFGDAQAQASRAGVQDFVYKKAIDTREWVPNSPNIRLPGEMGCTLSQVALLKKMHAECPPSLHLLVLEDDVHFTLAFQAKVRQELQNLSELSFQGGVSWAFMRLGASQYSVAPLNKTPSLSQDNAHTCGAFAILYNRQRVSDMLVYLEERVSKSRVEDTIDRLYIQPRFQARFPSVTMQPQIAAADVSSSSIRESRSALEHAQKMGWDLTRFPTYPLPETRHFEIIIPSFNNSEWITRNLESVFQQTYSNFSVTYVDDCSTDGTGDLAQKLLAHDKRGVYLRNERRMGQAFSRYRAYSACKGDSTCFMLDGDDWLAHKDVLRQVAVYMDSHQADMVYNSMQVSSEGQMFVPRVTSQEIGVEDYTVTEKANRGYRRTAWKACHPRVMEAHLLHHLDPKRHLINQGEWITCCTDLAESLTCLEHARNPVKIYLAEPAYVYNKDNSMRYDNSFFRHDESAEAQKRYTDTRAFVLGS